MASIKKITYPPGTPSEIDARIARSRYISPETLALTAGEGAGGIAGRGPFTEGASDAPPLVTRGESPEKAEYQRIVITETGEIKLVLKRKHFAGKAAFHDWINFTFHESTLTRTEQMVADEEFMMAYSAVLQQIFGMGITEVCPNGRNFYQKSYVIGDKAGFVCYGGQRNTILTMLNGEGLAGAKPGWEKRLYDYLNEAVGPKLTRVDLAYDDYEGQVYSVDKAKAEFEAGLYNCGGRMPDCEQRGNWYRPNGKGRTFYVGNRANGKYGRIYEKGKQLGDTNSAWVRLEAEFKSVDRVLPLRILLEPGEYLAAAYPAWGWISEEQCRIKTVQKATEISYEAMCNWLDKQCGSALAVVAEIEGSLEAMFAKVGTFRKMPERLRVPSYANSPMSLHEKIKERMENPLVSWLKLPEVEEQITGHAFA